MLYFANRQIIGWLLMLAGAAMMLGGSGLWRISALAPALSGVLLLLQGHAHRRGGWDQVSAPAAAIAGALLLFVVLAVVATIGFIWLGATRGFGD
jgi:hypothetical protein